MRDKKIIISASTYRLGKNTYNRLSVDSESGGTRIVGDKFGACPSINEINVELTTEKAREVINELENLISYIERKNSQRD